MTRRNPILSLLSSLVARALPSQEVTTGSSQSIAAGGGLSDRNVGGHYDQEKRIVPIRSPRRAKRLSQIAALPEAATIIGTVSNDVFSSQDGDDLGFTIADTLADGETLVDPLVQQICIDAINRTMRGNLLITAVEELLEGGDSFRSIVLDKRLTQVIKVKELPPWEMFRVEDADGDVVQFEQRQHSTDSDPDYVLSPAVCVHFRFRRDRLYGRGLFEEMYPDTISLGKGMDSLDAAVVSVGVNPNVHTLHSGADVGFLQQYKREHEQRVRTGRTITDYYMLPSQETGGDAGTVKKMAQINPDVKALLDNINARRRRFAMAGRLPPYLLGLETTNGKDIAGQPALAYSRFINGIRSILGEGIRQILDVELALNGITDADYRIIWPKIYVHSLENVMSGESEGNPEDDEMNDEAVEDLDSSRKVLNLKRRSGYGN